MASYVSIRDVQPVARFIAEVSRADALFRQMSAEDAKALPDSTLHAWSVLQQAVEALGVPEPAAEAPDGHVPGARPPRF